MGSDLILKNAPKSDKKLFMEETGWGSNGSPAPVFLSRGSAARNFLEALCNWWAKRYPHEVRGYLVEVGVLRDNFRGGTGKTKDGEMAQVGVIPSRIVAMGEQLIPGFWANGGRHLWFEMFPNFASRTRKLGHFTGA